MTTAETDVSFPVDHGALTDVPAWQAHKRGRNWAATLTGVDPATPGGLRREFWARAHGAEHFYILPTGPLIGTAVEFAADYTNSTDRDKPRRWFGVVVDLTADAVTMRKCATAREAINLAATIARETKPAGDDLRQQVIDLLNSKLTEPGQRWYLSRNHTYGTQGKRNGKIADWHFALRTDAAARAEGLVPGEDATIMEENQ